ncbi:phosphomethylpyrimidine synthase [Marinitoga sp. 1135]|uniref:Phosphomethylpyrimidine synthase n=1 Tax=Marinitoga piezophila (strain DSM 14283 / JCM 11233 / KA3) TaxID=443254 RepID=H2J7B4_MARPK|nr:MULTISPECIES: phosphomethylpyrimidine synthase ThiC [Marinitoga]AEX85306.1 thiamine biosynthesis protein ThiC [Marinitoga piezophila KA3]APT75791.1 phosphomethylpyrimidine synthase [Marinitoga sp. 1137]NUU95531.1 phosphomethylpyrimidine synthase [Marinitoga sp. 1135]NUU97458.1 phosphomethylpyrimidine synthase [Marinitoga sp. 1138]
MTQLEFAKAGIITEEMVIAAEYEGISPEELRNKIEKGYAVLPVNKNHKFDNIRAIGEGLKTKVNINLGTSQGYSSVKEEIEKLKIAEKFGADSIMDLSTWGNLSYIRDEIIRNSNIMVGTVPVYDAATKAVQNKKRVIDFDADDFIQMVRDHAKAGVDFMTIHAGITRTTIEKLRNSRRITKIVSRGGSIIVGWMIKNHKENPFYEYFDEVLEICREYDVTISLGDGMRPGSLHDATDDLQFEELLRLGELVKRARNAGVQVMVEGPGHMPIDEIEANVILQKKICDRAPFYVLGPITTDIAPGYDHITSAIGGAIAAAKGADFLCAVTPAEHLRLPTLEDIKEGVIATKIAAHSADIAKNRKHMNIDNQMSHARKEFNWEKQFEIAIDKEKALNFYSSRKGMENNMCSMCGPLCAMRITEEFLEKEESIFIE